MPETDPDVKVGEAVVSDATATWAEWREWRNRMDALLADQALLKRIAEVKDIEGAFAPPPIAIIYPAELGLHNPIYLTEQGLHDAVEHLDTAAGELVVIAQRAVEAAQKRGDEIDAMLADIRRFRAA